MKGERALVVMARYPEVGQVKTRLARTCGPQAATALYRAFIDDLDARFADDSRRLIWAYHPADRPFANVIPSGARCIAQQGADLGARMHACFAALRDAGFDSVVMIGADVPHVRSAWIAEAEMRLEDVDVVLGPSRDGGYYLVAMRTPHDIFTDVTMSTPTVLADTRHRIATLGLRMHLLPVSFDVDDAGDLSRLRDELRDAEVAAALPATTRWLEKYDRPSDPA